MPRREGGGAGRGPAAPAAVPAESLHLAGLQRGPGPEQPVQPDRLGAAATSARCSERGVLPAGAPREAHGRRRRARAARGTRAARPGRHGTAPRRSRRATHRSARSTSGSATRSSATSIRSSSCRRSRRPPRSSGRPPTGAALCASRSACSIAFEERLQQAWQSRGGLGASSVLLFSAGSKQADAFHPNLTFVQGHLSFQPDPANPRQLGVLQGRLGDLAAGEVVLGYLILPEGLPPGRALRRLLGRPPAGLRVPELGGPHGCSPPRRARSRPRPRGRAAGLHGLHEREARPRSAADRPHGRRRRWC